MLREFPIEWLELPRPQSRPRRRGPFFLPQGGQGNGTKSEWVCKPSSVRVSGAPPRGAIIHLGQRLPVCLGAAYPGIIVRRTTSLPLFGLAPDEVFPAICVAADAVSSYLTFSPLLPPQPKLRTVSGMFSVALSVGSPLLGVTQHPVLRSSDFPHCRKFRQRDRPTHSEKLDCQPDLSSQTRMVPQLSQK